MYMEEFTNKTNIYKAKTFGTTQLRGQLGLPSVEPLHNVNENPINKEKRPCLTCSKISISTKA